MIRQSREISSMARVRATYAVAGKGYVVHKIAIWPPRKDTYVRAYLQDHRMFYDVRFICGQKSRTNKVMNSVPAGARECASCNLSYEERMRYQTNRRLR